MLIVSSPPGQLCNNLWLFSAFIANAIEHGYRLVFDLGQYAEHFDATRLGRFSGHQISAKLARSRHGQLLARSLIRASFLLPVTATKWHATIELVGTEARLELSDEMFIRRVREGRVLMRVGLFHQCRDDANLLKHADLLREFFRPSSPCLENVQRLIAKWRHDDPVLVGVHIRRRDYRIWRAGRYFFSHEEYRDKMRQVSLLFQNVGRAVRFVVSSDESVSAGDFEGLDVRTGTGQLIEDLYLLAHCDRVMGPPSTFSTWASFFGRVPLCMIDRADKTIRDDDFEIAHSVNRILSVLDSDDSEDRAEQPRRDP